MGGRLAVDGVAQGSPTVRVQFVLDGTELPLVRADHAFIGIAVPVGEGDIRLAYRPRLFGAGAAMSSLAVLAAAAALSRPALRVAGSASRLAR